MKGRGRARCCARPWRGDRIQFKRQAQPAPPAPHPPDGCGDDDGRGAATPTMPGLERSFASFVPLQAGHAGARFAVTKASN
jgi:hypothetical protein